MLSKHVFHARDECLAAISALRSGTTGPLAAWLHNHLHGHVLPFWERHAFDPQGGLLTCLDDTGDVLSHDKWMWSQWQAVWTFSRVHQECQEDRWLERARQIIRFCARSGWTPQGWALVVSRSGRILRGHESIYTDAYAVYGLSEYHHVTGDRLALQLAKRTVDRARKNLAGLRAAMPQFPYPIPDGTKSHRLPMIWSLIFAEFGLVAKDNRYLRLARTMSEDAFRDFYRQDRDLVLEFVGTDGAEFRAPEGTAVVPGHVIQDMWFQIHLAEYLSLNSSRIAEACRLILRHLELGWDEERGGLRLAIDADSRSEVGWRFARSKLWWPHTEALYATLLGWSHTGDAVFLDWYERLWQICLDHYVDWAHGEWRQKLDHEFNPITETVALPVKDPFHLPRSLLLQIELLQRLVPQAALARSSAHALHFLSLPSRDL